MPRFERRLDLNVPVDTLWAWHLRPGAFERLAPPWQDLRVLQPAPVAEGSELRFATALWGVPATWVARHRDLVEGQQFVDEQLAGPFARWVHTHRFLDTGSGSALVDEVDYTLPAGALGRSVGGGLARRELERLFGFRHARTARDLARHAAWVDRGPLRIAISGASGLVGRALTAFLTTGGHQVRRLVRRASGAPDEIAWDPAAGTIDAAQLEGIDAVVHLAGENLGGARWSEAHKARVRQSRVDGTGLLARTLAELASPPRVLVSASAIGLYGDRGDEVLDESSAPGQGFLPEVCLAWEAAAEPARGRGLRVVHARIGVVLSARGGALQRLLTPFRLGAGGVVGRGDQRLSWIHLDDVVYALHRLILDDALRGPVNLTAPTPVDNRAFTRTLARVLGRPALLPLPAAAVRALLGEMGQALLLDGADVRPRALLDRGHHFALDDLEAALRFELGR